MRQILKNWMLGFNLGFLLRAAVSLGLLGWLAISVEWPELHRAVVRLRWSWILAAVLFTVLAVVISVIKWRVLLKAQGLTVGWSELWRTYWAGLFFNNFLPSSIGGDALRIAWVGRQTGDTPGAAASVIVERGLAAIGLALVGLTAALFIPWPEPMAASVLIILTVVSLAVLALLVWVRLPVALCHHNNRIIRRAVNFITRAQQHGKMLKNRPRVVVAVLLWSVVFQVCVVAVNYSIFMGLELYQLNWLASMFVVPVASAAAMVPLGINGYGLREGAYVYLLSGFRVPAADAFTASIIFAFLISICSLWGGWFWLSHRQKGDQTNAGCQST